MCEDKLGRIPITNDFMFCRVMAKPDICRAFLQALLPEISVGRVTYPKSQYSIEEQAESRGIRLDVYTKDESRVYNIEMQCARVDDLPRRSRYYLGRIDGDLLGKGQAYATLRESYVIFICTFDPFGKKFPLYHFENRCREDPTLFLNDGTYKIFVYTGGKSDMVSPDLAALLAYFEDAAAKKENALIKAIDHEVDIANRDADWRRKMLTLEMKMNDQRLLGWKEGRSEGLREGRSEGLHEGEVKTNRKNALKMLRENCDPTFISKITGLSEKEILSLRNKNESEI
ncbi:MAG: Rpn family recombination-promoting nuclease/putative transposase [Eubacterium sp.]|nr:Rpn family recombination-promoting nuclease/putative transposase [Eubacterium sp.]